MPKTNEPSQKRAGSRLLRRLRAMRVNRAVFLSAVVILLALATVLIITVISNRARRERAEEVIRNVPQDELTEPAGTQTPEPSTTDRGSSGTSPSHQVRLPDPEPETVPTLSLPVEGSLLRAHSADIQVFSPTMQDYRIHLGVDLMTAAGAPVLAAADGTIARIWEDPLMGTCVAVQHTGDCRTVYKNLAAELTEGIVAGAKVSRGQRIGTVGDTAQLELAEEPHLHLEVTVGDVQVDPLDYFPAATVASLTEDAAYEDAQAEK